MTTRPPTGKRKPKKIGTDLTDDESMILWPFLDMAEQGEGTLARYIVHCGIDADDIGKAGDVQSAILHHYERPDGTYDVQAAAHDLARWPPIAARVKELRRRHRSIASGKREPRSPK